MQSIRIMNQLIMTQAQMKDFEAKCLDHLPHREAKRIITFLAQYVTEVKASPASNTKEK